jgi:YhcH/YjgK/YiaL family protein
MIIDSILNLGNYLHLEGGFRESFDFLKRKDLQRLPEGWHEVGEGPIRAGVTNGPGRQRRGARLETHRKHVDLQFILSGTDRMGWKPRVSCRMPHGGYDNDKDVEFFDDDPEFWFKLEAGMFAIFFPEDAHMPQICRGPIHKVVVKLPTHALQVPGC